LLKRTVWAYGPNWPGGGEIDIIEGANNQYSNIMSAHTAPGCSLDSDLNGNFSGIQREATCDIGNYNVGCGYSSSEDDGSAYGDGFNAAKGGVYAMEWDAEFIKIWHFARSNIPQDIGLKHPDPTGWGVPSAIFGGNSCDVDKFFKNMSLVINIVSAAVLEGDEFGENANVPPELLRRLGKRHLGHPGRLRLIRTDLQRIRGQQPGCLCKRLLGDSVH
jgi:hypothetical protein